MSKPPIPSCVVVPHPTGIVVGVIKRLTVEDARIGARAPAHVGGHLVDLDLARDIASRRCGEAAEAELGKALNKLISKGGPNLIQRVEDLSKAMRGILALAEGIVSGRPSAIAVQVANGLVNPEWVLTQQGEDRMDLVVMAYATLHLDEQRRIEGGIS